ncbi:RNA-binding protein [Aestuariivirga sp.]|uniref:RNA-binding protein n=1 Tax=Aestuariivirga sp. TaxID=2650926 RepID=UPI003783A58C
MSQIPSAPDIEADQPLADRMCIVTRTVKDEAELIRFVRSPDGVAVPDLARKLPGRGVWVSLDRGVLAEAVKKKLFSRGFSAETTIPPDLPDMVSTLLRQQVLSLLSLAKKAGEAVAGFMKVEEMLGRGRAKLLFHGTDAALDGCRKLDRLAAPEVERVALFERRELDLAFGRPNVVHAAVAKGGLAEKLSAAVRRIVMFEGLEQARRGPEERR